MIISLLVYVIFNKYLPSKQKEVKEVKVETNTSGSKVEKLKSKNLSVLIAFVIGIVVALGIYLPTGNRDVAFAVGIFVVFVAWLLQAATKEERPRVSALLLVFLVVIFFWMSFHQNGLTLTFFAKDYTVKAVDPFTNIFFNLNSILAFIGAFVGLFVIILRKKISEKLIGLAMLLGLGYYTYYLVNSYTALNPIEPEIFQSFNPLFIVVLTFPVMAIFTGIF